MENLFKTMEVVNNYYDSITGSDPYENHMELKSIFYRLMLSAIAEEAIEQNLKLLPEIKKLASLLADNFNLNKDEVEHKLKQLLAA